MRRAVVLLVLVAAAVSAGTLSPRQSTGGVTATRSIGLITKDGADGYYGPVETGGRSAAKALGVHLVVTRANFRGTRITTINSLVAHHVAAIAINGDAGVGEVLAALAKARVAHIPTLSYGGVRPRGGVWVNLSSTVEYARALADALASQMNQEGEFVIVSCLRSAGANPIVGTWLKLSEGYIQRRYPQMQRVGVAYGDLRNGDVDTDLFNRLMTAHPRLRGLIFLCPGEADNQPPLLVRAHDVGKVFTAGNGGGCPPVGDNWLTSVRLGAEEVVCEGDPTKLGYLTVWAADYLARGHRFVPGSYDVGGPVGTVQYFRHNQELRLGQPLTITKANLAQYAGEPCPPATPWPC